MTHEEDHFGKLIKGCEECKAFDEYGYMLLYGREERLEKEIADANERTRQLIRLVMSECGVTTRAYCGVEGGADVEVLNAVSAAEDAFFLMKQAHRADIDKERNRMKSQKFDELQAEAERVERVRDSDIAAHDESVRNLRESNIAMAATIQAIAEQLNRLGQADMVASGGEGPDQCTFGCAAPGERHTKVCPWHWLETFDEDGDQDVVDKMLADERERCAKELSGRLGSCRHHEEAGLDFAADIIREMGKESD